MIPDLMFIVAAMDVLLSSCGGAATDAQIDDAIESERILLECGMAFTLGVPVEIEDMTPLLAQVVCS